MWFKIKAYKYIFSNTGLKLPKLTENFPKFCTIGSPQGNSNWKCLYLRDFLVKDYFSHTFIFLLGVMGLNKNKNSEPISYNLFPLMNPKLISCKYLHNQYANLCKFHFTVFYSL